MTCRFVRKQIHCTASQRLLGLTSGVELLLVKWTMEAVVVLMVKSGMTNGAAALVDSEG